MLLSSLGLIVLVIAVIISIVLGLITIKNNSVSKTNSIFFFLTLVTSLWLFVNYLSVHPNSQNILFLMRMSIFLAVPQILLVYLFSHTVPYDEIKLSNKALFFVIFLSFVVMLINMSPFAFVNLDLTEGSIRPQPGIGLLPFALFAIVLSLNSIYTFIYRYRNEGNEVKEQIGLVMTGILIMFGLIIATILLPVLLFRNNSLVALSPLYVLVFLGITTYAILKYQLFNLKVIATQVLTVVIWVILFARLFVTQSIGELLVDSFILLGIIVFGVLLVRSVSSEVKQREKLQELTEKLKALDKQKDEFLSMAAHELRAPMTAIKGYVSMVLEGDTGDIPEKARGFLADTNNITDRLIRLVNNMLNVSRIEEGRLTFQSEEEYLSVPVKSVFNQFIPEAERKGLKYTLAIPKTLKDKVIVDPDRIQEVIGNFISNAVKYTDEGFIEVKMIQPNESTVRVEVNDSGPGISKEEQVNLFQKFHRVESNVGKTTGTGLGLYISKLLMEKFKGKIGVDSEPGKGSTFWFELPLVG